MKRTRIIFHSFYCIKCGNKSYDLPRKQGHKHERFHRKKLYCPSCKIEINHVECQNEDDIYNFKLDFEEEVFIDEVKESLVALRDTRLR